MTTSIGKKITEIRKQKGLTQEEVSEKANINLRTLQRIEKDETEPRGNTLNSICNVLGINIEDILDYGKQEDKSYLVFLHLSVLSGLFLPLGNIILPLILWLNKKNNINSVATQGSNIVNFQIIWTIVLFVVTFSFAFIKIMHIGGFSFTAIVVFIIVMYVLLLIFPVYAAIQINRGRRDNFYPTLFKIIK